MNIYSYKFELERRVRQFAKKELEIHFSFESE